MIHGINRKMVTLLEIKLKRLDGTEKKDKKSTKITMNLNTKVNTKSLQISKGKRNMSY